jgi:hypothetical protein
LSESIEINAEPSKVREALTKPEIKDIFLELKPLLIGRLAALLFFRVNTRQNYQDKGIIRENVQNKILSYSCWSGFSGLEDKP